MNLRERKKHIFLICVFVFSALACLQPAAAAVVATDPGPAEPTRTIEPSSTEGPAGAVFWIQTPAQRCVKVTAAEALTLRTGATLHSQSIDYLVSGEVVRLVSDLDPDWWLISRAGSLGYARASFLVITACP